MKKIFSIFKHDLKKIFRSVIAFIVVIGLSVLPALYAWFNIASNWNPYDNSGNIPVAVVNLDKGCKIGPIKTSFGDNIVDNLKKNTQMGWKFVDKDTADQGIIDGDYYAVVVISENFSENLVSIASGELKRPEITYLVNEKKNAIAPKITDKGIQAIQTEVNSSFVAEITNIAATVLNTSSDEISENKDKICDNIISTLDDGKISLDSLKSTIDVISGSMDSVNSLIKSNKDSLPKLKDKLKDTNEFVNSIKDASTAIKSASTGLSSTLESSITSLDSLTSSFSNQLNTIITKVNNGSKDIADDLQNLTDICNKIIEINNDIINILNSLDNTGSSGITSLVNTIETSTAKISSLIDSLSQKLDTIFDTIEKDTSTVADKLNEIKVINQSIIAANNELISALNTLSEKFGIDTSDAVAKQSAIISKINDATQKIKETGSLPKDLKSDIDAIIKETQNSITQIKTEINTLISNVKADIKVSDIVEFLTDMNKTQNQIISKLNSVSSTLKNSNVLPADFGSEIKVLADSTKNSIANFKSNYLTPAKKSIEKVINKSGDALDKVSDVLTSSTVTDDIEESLNSAQKIVTSVSGTFNDVEKLIDKGINNIDTIKKKIQNLKENSTIENLIGTVFGDPKAVSDFISSPVKINTEKIFPVSDYGSAMAPFYTVLALWVGGIVLVAVLKTELSKSDIKTVGNVKPYQEYFGRYLIFMVISLLQATITALGDVFFLKIQCDNLFLFILTTWITIIVFSLLIYSLTISFSVIGKAIAVIILIVQVAGSGGTFPPELLPDFFQNLIRFMPFNYAINAVRETIAGVTYSAYRENILYLLCFIPLALIIGILFRKPCMGAMRFFNKRLEETDLIL